MYRYIIIILLLICPSFIFTVRPDLVLPDGEQSLLSTPCAVFYLAILAKYNYWGRGISSQQ